MKLLLATRAIIYYEGKILLIRESSKYEEGSREGLYDFPGGRVTPGERFDESLKREVKEETGLDIEIHEPFFVDEWRPTVKNEQLHIVGIFFRCTSKTDKVVLSEDHDKYEWINPEDCENYNYIPMYKDVFKAINDRLRKLHK